jgi:hypothetical protein
VHVDDCQLLDIRTIFDHRGSISFIEAGIDIGFPIRRVYWTYDVPSRSTRAGHAHYRLEQIYVAISGSFDVLMDDGKMTRTIHMNHPDIGLALRPGIWRKIINFSSNACLMVLASDLYDESDYIRDYNEFLVAVASSAFSNNE